MEQSGYYTDGHSDTRTLGIMVVAVLLLGLWGQFRVDAEKHHEHPQLPIYDKAVNETLDMTLEVGSDWRTEKRKFTWNEIQLEVARRLHVQRKEPWNR